MIHEGKSFHLKTGLAGLMALRHDRDWRKGDAVVHYSVVEEELMLEAVGMVEGCHSLALHV